MVAARIHYKSVDCYLMLAVKYNPIKSRLTHKTMFVPTVFCSAKIGGVTLLIPFIK